jgi:hypothetical protein
MKNYIWLIALMVLILRVAAADTTTLDPGTSTDWNLWIISGLIGLALFLLSLNPPSSKVSVEVDAIVSVMAWIPIGFCAYASFSVSRVVGTGYQTLYSMTVIGVLMFVFLVVAVINTLRIIALHRMFSSNPEQEPQYDN